MAVYDGVRCLKYNWTARKQNRFYVILIKKNIDYNWTLCTAFNFSTHIYHIMVKHYTPFLMYWSQIFQIINSSRSLSKKCRIRLDGLWHGSKWISLWYQSILLSLRYLCNLNSTIQKLHRNNPLQCVDFYIKWTAEDVVQGIHILLGPETIDLLSMWSWTA